MITNTNMNTYANTNTKRDTNTITNTNTNTKIVCKKCYEKYTRPIQDDLVFRYEYSPYIIMGI